MAEELQSSTDVPSITTAPDTTFRAALVIAGATQAAASLYQAPVTNEEQRSVYYLPGGVNTVLTVAMMRYDIIAADNPSMTTLEVPENATLGLSFADATIDHRFYAQNRGAGGLTVNFTGAADLDSNINDLVIEDESAYHTEYCYWTRAADSWNLT